MIKAINSINFQGIYVPKTKKLSQKQERVLDDIREKLGDKQETENFLAMPKGAATIELSRVFGFKEYKQNKLGIDYTYLAKFKIGKYEHSKLFDMKDYNENKEIVKEYKFVVPLMIAVGALMLGLIAKTGNINKLPQTKEVKTVVVDTIQSLKVPLK